MNRELRILYFVSAFCLGALFAFGWGHYADRDRDKYAPAIIEYFDMRASSYDVESGTTFIQPRHPRPDPEDKP